MNDRVDLVYDAILAKLEFPVVLDRLARSCHFSVAAERARELGPSGDVDQVKYLLSVTAESVDLLTYYPELTIGGARDIRAAVERAARGARLASGDLLLIQDTIHAGRNLRQTFARMLDSETRYPLLTEFVGHLSDLGELDQAIGRTVGPRGDILDTASEALARIRRDVRVSQSRLMDRLNSLVSSPRYASAVQDQIVTMRDGRYVIPLRSDARSVVPGIVHDTSASGQTLFVEPFEVVELNNRWREQQAAEQHEIDRILDELSERVGAKAAALNETVEAIAAVDLAMAKARLAFDMRATCPRIVQPQARSAARRPGAQSDSGDADTAHGHPTHRIRLIKARHPLLDPATVVPIDIHAGESFRLLVITGPNTGGKTVALKTVGLLALMAQTGLYLPVEDESEISVFPAVFVDIGDEQSIAQSLSTFSAHMRSIISMLQHVSDDSLVLLDELGAGTDPQEGSALARALLSELLERGPLVIATTHFSEVKAFAYATAGVENASVEFDVQSLSPTYRLTIGVPGESNALAIARRLGLPKSVLAGAARLLTPDDRRTDALLQDIRRRKEETDAILQRAEETKREAEQLRRLAARSLRAADEERQTARSQALAESESELAQIRETLRDLQTDRETLSTTREHIERRRTAVEDAAATVKRFRKERVERPRPVAVDVAATRPIRLGDRVMVTSLETDGEVILIEDGFAEVQMGVLKLRQPLTALQRLGRSREPENQKRIIRPKFEESVPLELDLRGNRAADLPEMLEAYIEGAYRSGLPYIRIIHGKGTGALREVVRNHLHKHPAIQRSELAPNEQGGDGVTVAYMNEG